MASLNGKVLYWILGALLTINLALGAVLYQVGVRRLDRIDDRIQALAVKTEAIQAEYQRIAVIEARLEEILRYHARGPQFDP